MRCDKAHDKNENADAERAPTNPEKLIEIALDDAHSVGKMSAEGIAQLPRRSRLSDTVGEMDNDSDWLIDGQFARPTDYEILGLAIQVSLSKRKWVKGMKELRNLVDAKLDCVLCDSGCHFILMLMPSSTAVGVCAQLEISRCNDPV